MAEEEQQLIETVDEKGNIIKFELYDIVEVDEQEYALLIPVETEDEEEEIERKRRKNKGQPDGCCGAASEHRSPKQKERGILQWNKF